MIKYIFTLLSLFLVASSEASFIGGAYISGGPTLVGSNTNDARQTALLYLQGRILSDDTGPVFTSDLIATSIDENSGSGQAIYTAVATDASGVTYSLKEVDDFAAFTIDPLTGEVTLTEDLDFESQSSYTFTVVSTDGLGNSSEQAVTLSIDDVDEVDPAFTSGLTAPLIAENVGSGQAIYTAVATDISGVTYALKEVDDYAFFTIDESTGVVTLSEDLDYRVLSSYSFTVLATDSLGNTSELSVTYEAPPFQIISGSFTWAQAKADAESRGGRLAVLDTQEKIDVANNYLKSIVGTWYNLYIGLSDEDGIGAWVWIDGTPLTVDNWYEGEPNNLSTEHYVQILPSTHETASQPTGPRWNNGFGSHPGYLLEIAPNLRINERWERQIYGNGDVVMIDHINKVMWPYDMSFGPEQEWHEASSSVSNLTYAGFSDWRLPSFYELETIDQNDQHLLFDDIPISAENSRYEAFWANSGAPYIDADHPTLAGYYHLYGQNDGLPIVSAAYRVGTPLATVRGWPVRHIDYDQDGLLDIDEVNTYNTNPYLADTDGDSLSDWYEINNGLDPSVADVDENAPVFTSGSTATSIAENSGAGQSVYTAVATDALTVSYTLKEVDDSASFTIDESTGAVTLTEDPDYESQASYTFTVVATDELGHSSEQAVTLAIVDVDENAPVFTSLTSTSSIAENTGSNQSVYTAVATDASGLTYTLKEVDDFASFTIDESTGVVTLTEDPDYESQAAYSFTVIASDSLGNSSEQAVTLAITDVDENAPVFTSGSTAQSIAENTGSEIPVYIAVATDASVVTYSLKEVDDFAAYTIDESRGIVRLIEDPDYESQASYTFTVVATDELGHSSEQAVTLAIVDVDESTAFWHSDAVDLGDNWRYNDWLGYFNISTDPWIYHNEHGWLYVFPSVTDTDSVYFWDNSMQSVLWTSKSIYPSIYRFTDSKWIWYQEGSKNPRWFNILGTDEWEERE